MMESELAKARLLPSIENPAVDIERFVMRHLQVRMDQHASLDPGVLGLTEFFSDRPPKISISADLSRALDDDDSPIGLQGRCRATIAHESSHVLMHRVLFIVADEQKSLFNLASPSSESQRLLRCTRTDVLFRGGPRDEREIQANLGMAALLMPRTFFRTLSGLIMRELGRATGDLTQGSSGVALLAAELSRRCVVSRQAAAIRLETLGVVSPRGQGRILAV